MAEDKVDTPEAGASQEKAARRRKAAQTTFTDPKVAKRNLYVLVLMVLVAVPVASTLPGLNEVFDQLSLRSYDLMVQANDIVRRHNQELERSPPHVAVVGIDDASLERYGRWPWNRSLIGDLVDGLKALEVKTVAMDVLFAEAQPSPLDGLEEVVAALPEAARTPEMLRNLDSISKVQAYLQGLPPEIQADPVVEELQRRLVPPWEDELFRRSILAADNVVLGMVVESYGAGSGSAAWLGKDRVPDAPRNVVELVRLRDPQLTEAELQQSWDDGGLHGHFFDIGKPFPPMRIAARGGQEIAQEDDGHSFAADARLGAPYQDGGGSLTVAGLMIPLPKLLEVAAGAGFMNDSANKDAVARRLPLFRIMEEYGIPSLSLAALADYHDAEIELLQASDGEFQAIRLARNGPGGREIAARFECSDSGEVYVNFYGSRELVAHREIDGQLVPLIRRVPVLTTIPAFRILDAFRVPPDETPEEAERRAEEQRRLRALVQNRVVFVGATAAGLTDLRSTPLGELRPGVEAHASIVANTLDGSLLRARPYAETMLQTFSTLVFMIVLAFLMPRMRPLAAFAFFLVLLGLAAAWSLVVFRHGSILWPFDIMLPIAVFFGVGMAYLNLIENKEKAWLDGMFKRYVSPEYVEQIKANKGRLDLNGKEEIITPFFSDMAKFSTISEAFTAEGLFRFLGEYLGEMADILDEYGGTLDKFEGDAVVAFFGAPIPFDDHAAKACLASLHMQRRIKELEREWQTSDRYPELHVLAKKVGHWFPIRVRIGLNTGPCATGHLGTAERGNYTMMGDTVNLAARLEAAGKQYGIALTISEDTYQAAKDVIEARPVDIIQVVGRTVGTPIYEVMAPAGDLTEPKQHFLKLYQEAWGLYRGRQFADARRLYGEALGIEANDQVCKIFIERCQEYEASPPPENWDGVHILTSK